MGRFMMVCGTSLLLLTAAGAQEKPTLNETVEWIQKTCAVEISQAELIFDGCIVSGFWRQPNDDMIPWFATLSLKNIKSLEVNPYRSKWRIQLHTDKLVPAHFGRRSGAIQKTNQFDIALNNKETAERIHAALLHAIGICKQQKEPF